MTTKSLDAYPVVLQVLPALGGGGVERGTVEMTAAITQAGGCALVASAGGMLAKSVERAGGRNILLPLDTKSPFAILRNAGRLAEVIRQEKVDIVHARSRAPAWSAYLAARRTGVKFVTTYHGAYNENVWLKRRYNAVMARGDIVIAISNFIANMIVERHHVDPARIRVIYRGADPAVFDPDAVNPARLIKLSRAWRLEDGQPVVLLPGRLTRWKGQTVLIEALARMTNKDVCAVLVGDVQGRNRYLAELTAIAEKLGVSNRLRMVIEAQSMAGLVIATNHGGAVETIEHDVTGWRVSPGDADELAAGLDYALSLPEDQRAEIGAAARASVIANYTVARMQAATLDVYREVLTTEEPEAGPVG